MELKSNQSRLLINLRGGKIEELVLDGVKILGTYDRIDGKTGSTHICVPNFASEGTKEYDLPFHGPARNMEWQVVKQTETSLEIKVVIEALEKYKSAIVVTQIFKLDSRVRPSRGATDRHSRHENDEAQTSVMVRQAHHDIFYHEVSVKNIGTVTVPVNIGIHNYFDTPNGWQNARLNNKNIKIEIEKNLSVPIPVMVRQAHHDKMQIPKNSRFEWLAEGSSTFCNPELAEGSIQSPILITTQGANEFVTWSGVKDGKYDSKYACIEPVISFDNNYFGSETSLLYHGKTRAMSQTISLT